MESQSMRDLGVCPGGEMAESIKRAWIMGSGPQGRTVIPELPKAQPLVVPLGERLPGFILTRDGKRSRKQDNFFTTNNTAKRYPGKLTKLSVLDDHFLFIIRNIIGKRGLLIQEVPCW